MIDSHRMGHIVFANLFAALTLLMVLYPGPTIQIIPGVWIEIGYLILPIGFGITLHSTIRSIFPH